MDGPSEANTESPPIIRQRWSTVAVLSAIAVVAYLDRQILSLLVGYLKADLHLSDTQIGLLQGFSFAVLYATAGLPLGYAADRLPRRWIIFFGILIWSVATIAAGGASSYSELVMTRVFVGFGEAALLPAAMSMLSDIFARRQLATALSIFSLGILLGGITALLAGSWIISLAAQGMEFPLIGARNVWQSTFILTGIPGIVMAPLIFLVREPTRRERAGAGEVGSIFRFMGQHKAFFILHFAAFSLLMALVFSVLTWLPVLLLRQFGWSIVQVAHGFALLVGTTGAIGLLANGRIVDIMFGRGTTDAHFRYFACGTLVMATSAFALLIAPSALAVLLVLIPLAIFNNFAGVASAALHVVTPSELRGRILSVYLLIVNLFGVSVGPASVGAIADNIFPGKNGLQTSLAVFCIITAILASACLWLGLKPMRAAVRQAGPD